jgi:hypothetical protein
VPEILEAVVVFLGAIIGGVITVLIGPWVSQQFKLRENYIVPFLKWCTEFYGDLYEFRRRYVGEDLRRGEYSDILIILDYRSLHDTLIDSYKWIGKIKKEEKDKENGPSECIVRIVETVEKLWHQLENQYPDILPSVEGVKPFNKEIKTTLSGPKKDKIGEIAKRIMDDLLEEPKKYKKEDFDIILNYLIDKVPKSKGFF